METTEVPVLIVGAGPTGLTLACELARRGVGVRVVDASSGPQQGSRGKGVQPRTLEVLDDLGVVEQVLAHGEIAMPIIQIGPDGQERRGGAVPEAFLGRPDIPYPASLTTPEWRIEEALRDRLAELGGRVEFGTTLLGLEEVDAGVVATLATAGGEQVVRTRWLVGADGGHSVVRKQAGIAFEGETLEDVRMLVADVAVEGLDRDAWRMWRHEEGFLSLCPLPSTDLFQLQSSVAPGQDPSQDLANLQAAVDRRTGRTDIRLVRAGWTSLWRANVRLAARYRVGHALIAGDAAHIHSPAGGQGMNTGIQDGHNLGWKLAAVLAGAPEALIDTYEEERRPVAADVLALSNARLQQTMTTRQVPTNRDATTMQLTVGYRWSSLVADDRDDDAALRAGDRAPDATELRTADGARRLFDLTRGGRWTLLDFGADAGSLPSVTTLRVGVDVIDEAGHLADAYAAGARTLVLLRPDGVIGAISDAGEVALIQDVLSRAS